MKRILEANWILIDRGEKRKALEMRWLIDVVVSDRPCGMDFHTIDIVTEPNVRRAHPAPAVPMFRLRRSAIAGAVSLILLAGVLALAGRFKFENLPDAGTRAIGFDENIGGIG